MISDKDTYKRKRKCSLFFFIDEYDLLVLLVSFDDLRVNVQLEIIWSHDVFQICFEDIIVATSIPS